ncbi:TonB-dependent siderophore receptor [Bdellovibrio bacteriovorus]|uniref:TonB-dependent siderophore receptor n=1 Tax=Bdellovibrio TaxID=958 RepID=UPI0035A946BB
MVKKLLLLLLLNATQARAESEISTIRITDPSTPEVLDISGFGDIPEKDLPLSATSVSTKTIEENGLHRLSDITLIDASTTDSYNATGYWDYLSVRGFTLENRYNFQREGLPISAETSIGLENKERVEILKGLGGIQAGAGSPGGMVNYVVKRPTNKSLKVLRTEVSEQGNVLTAVDVGGHFQNAEQFGYRLNLAHEKLEPHLKKTSGTRSLVGIATDWRIDSNSILEAEIEWSQRSQPSQAGFSLLGNNLPDPVEPTLNLNNQSWTEPVEFFGLTGSVKYTQNLSAPWSWSFAAGAQDLTTNDRLAYPFGCSAENNYDRYCSDGTYDMYDYRSEDETRKTYAAKTALQGGFITGDVSHQLTLGFLGNSTRERFQRQAYNYAGVGNVEGTGVGTPNPTLNDESTNRDTATYEISLSDSAKLGKWKGWLGLRYTNLNRSSFRTDGSRNIDYTQNFATPWAALSYDFENVMAYTSFGQGLESFVTPNKNDYTHPGEFIPDVTSKQIEVGLRGGKEVHWNIAAFQITRPVVTDLKPDYQIDGEAEHRGVEVQTSTEWGSWELGVSAMRLEATRKGSTLLPDLNGKKPVNVPENTLRMQAAYRVLGVPGLAFNTRLSHESERAVLADNSIMLPAWTRWDLGASYAHTWEETKLMWRLSVDNVTNQRYWKESPTQYGHIYLYPGEARSFYLSLQASL